MPIALSHRTRATVRKYAPSALVLVGLMAVATSAGAADDAFLANLGDFICGIATFISTKWLFVIGIVVIILGAIGLANAESTLAKLLSVTFMGLGIAAAAPAIMRKFGVLAACQGF
ncbi:TrbC/VirB2 family protein [Cupriavidus plantarum]|uniref:TrbC/VirB2 family protein n=1 Tax=Cupriavidus plantarum TaxID=942865 RepID=UPI00339DA448